MSQVIRKSSYSTPTLVSVFNVHISVTMRGYARSLTGSRSSTNTVIVFSMPKDSDRMRRYGKKSKLLCCTMHMASCNSAGTVSRFCFARVRFRS